MLSLWFFSFFSFAVSLQPFEYDPLEKNRHKFMVQAMYAPEGEINSDSLVRKLTMWDEKEIILISNSFCGRWRWLQKHEIDRKVVAWKYESAILFISFLISGWWFWIGRPVLCNSVLFLSACNSFFLFLLSWI